MDISYGPAKRRESLSSAEQERKLEKERILNSIPNVDRNAKLTHVDEWVTMGSGGKATEGEKYARFFFMMHRLHSSMQDDFRPWIAPHELYCDFAGRTWRVTGASRMGDIWLAIDLTGKDGYDIRRYVDECTNWRSHP